MNDTSTWFELLGSMEPSKFRRFLRGRNWSENQSSHGLSCLYTRTIDNQDIELEIPIDQELADYKRRIFEASEIIVLAENISYQELVASLNNPASDIISFRYISEETKDGSIPLDDSIRIREARKQILLSIAHSVIEPLPHFPRLSKSKAVEFINQCREAPSQVGSFVSEVMIPVSPAIGKQDELDAPFARQVTKQLATAINQAAQYLDQGNDDALLDAYTTGLSSNFLTALAKLQPPGGRGALDINFRWASSRPIEQTVPTKVRIVSDLFSPLSEAARVLRETSQMPGYELEGFVAGLQRPAEDATKPGKIVLVAAIDDFPGMQRIHITLDPEQYQRAMDAHSRAAKIRITGTLSRKGRKFILDDPGGLVVPEPSDNDDFGS